MECALHCDVRHTDAKAFVQTDSKQYQIMRGTEKDWYKDGGRFGPSNGHSQDLCHSHNPASDNPTFADGIGERHSVCG